MRVLRNFLSTPAGIIASFVAYIFVFSIVFHAFGASYQHGNGTSHMTREYAEDIALEVCTQIAGACEISRDWESKSINDFTSQYPDKNFVVALDPGAESIKFTIVGKKTVPGCVLSSEPTVIVDTTEYYYADAKASQLKARYCTIENGVASDKEASFDISDALSKYNHLHKHQVVDDWGRLSAWIKYFAFSVKATTSLGFSDVVPVSKAAEAGVTVFALVGALFWAFIVAAIMRAMGGAE